MFTKLANESDFHQLFTSSPVLVLNFYADWAEPCAQMNLVFEELSKKHPTYTFVQIEAESYPDISEKYEISCVPTFILIQAQKVIGTVQGADTKQLTQLIQKPLPYQSISAQPQTIEQKLTKLIHSNEIMMFIKGTPDKPKCGFSKTCIELMNGLRVQYGTFDILGDEQVRQELKTFSNWPTYPQVYVKGELIGGVDILEQMIHSGDFQAMLSEEDIQTRLKKLINRAPVMLFMKGTPARPQCGFSNTIVKLLNDQKVDFDSFDILGDEEVRQELKTFSNWPTYPQVYIKGELIGGLDILKEMVESGDFQAMLR